MLDNAESCHADVDDGTRMLDFQGTDDVSVLTLDDWVRYQQEDDLIGPVRRLKLQSSSLGVLKSNPLNRDQRLLIKEWHKLVVRDGVLYRRSSLHGEIRYQIVLPKACRSVP